MARLLWRKIIESKVITLLSVKYGGRVENHDLGVVKQSISRANQSTISSLLTKNRLTMHSNAAVRSYGKATSVWEIDVSICNIFSRISHGCYGTLERWDIVFCYFFQEGSFVCAVYALILVLHIICILWCTEDWTLATVRRFVSCKYKPSNWTEGQLYMQGTVTSPSSSRLQSITMHLLWYSHSIFQKSFTVEGSGPWVAM